MSVFKRDSLVDISATDCNGYVTFSVHMDHNIFNIAVNDVFDFNGYDWICLFDSKVGFCAICCEVGISVVCNIDCVVVCIQSRHINTYDTIDYWLFNGFIIISNLYGYITFSIYINCNGFDFTVGNVFNDNTDVRSDLTYCEVVFGCCTFVFFACREV